MSAKSGLKKTFSWRFGPSKFNKKFKPETEGNAHADSEHRRHSNSFPIHQVAACEQEDSATSPGLISDLLDGVVFTPVGRNEPIPRPSPDFRSCTHLSSFKDPPPAPPSLPSVPVKSCTPDPLSPPAAPLPTKSADSCDVANSPFPQEPPQQLTFHKELSAVIRRRQSGIYRQPDKLIEPASPVEEEVTYAAIDESQSHYQTIRRGRPLAEDPESERLYDNVCPDDPAEVLYANFNQSDHQPIDEEEGIYENVEELQQTYANIRSPDPSLGKSNVLTALILDVNSNNCKTSKSTGTPSSSSSGNSSLPSTSPQVSPSSDSLTEGHVQHVGSTRSISRSPDSGVFVGLLRPAAVSADGNQPLVIRIKERPNLLKRRLSETIKQFEQLEKESSTLVTTSRRVRINKETGEMEEMPLDELLDMVQAEPSLDGEGQDEDLEGIPPPQMPSSPPPSAPQPKSRTVVPSLVNDGIFQASVANVDSQPSSVSTDEMNNNSLEMRSMSPISPRGNMGALIVEDKIRKQQLKDQLRSEKVGIENIGDSFEDIERERLDIIEQLTPKARMHTTWLPGSSADDETKFGKQTTDGGGVPKRDIDSDSIVANKEQTKLYWETKMLDAQNIGSNNDAHHSTVYSKNYIHPAKMEAPLSPPPGFESPRDTQHNGQLLQSTDDFVDVGSVIVEDDNESDVARPEPKKPIDDVIHYSPPAEMVAARHTDKGAHRKMPQTYFNDVDTDNPQETLIEREIRQQREREEALAREREVALQMLQAAQQGQKQSQPTKDVKKEMNGVAVSTPHIRKDTSVATKKKGPSVAETELRISEEIRELRRREDELRILREANARNAHLQNLNHEPDDDRHTSNSFTDEGYDDPDGHSDGRDASSDSNNSRVASPETMDTKFPHQRTQSMDSMSSGHSSSDHHPAASAAHLLHSEVLQAPTAANLSVLPVKRQVSVKPLDEPEETPPYRQVLKETPIEREIRLVKEREEALRREKGLPTWSASVPKSADKDVRLAKLADYSAESMQSAAAVPVRNSRNSGSISKSVSTPHLEQSGVVVPSEPPAVSVRAEEESVEVRSQPRITARGPVNTAGYSTAPATTVTSVRRFPHPTGGAQRGLMQKFLASRGRMNSQLAFATVNSHTAQFTAASPPLGDGAAVNLSSTAAAPQSRSAAPSHKNIRLVNGSTQRTTHSNVDSTPVSFGHLHHQSAHQTEKNRDQDESEAGRTVPPRRHLATTEEKIQAELREMKKREEELKFTRMTLMAKSQPNLLACMDADDDDDSQNSFQREASGPPSISNGVALRSAVSNPSLLDDDDAPTERHVPSVSMSAVKGARRKSALIAQWENRIQQNEH